jgi:hypothetical protein
MIKSLQSKQKKSRCTAENPTRGGGGGLAQRRHHQRAAKRASATWCLARPARHLARPARTRAPSTAPPRPPPAALTPRRAAAIAAASPARRPALPPPPLPPVGREWATWTPHSSLAPPHGGPAAHARAPARRGGVDVAVEESNLMDGLGGGQYSWESPSVLLSATSCAHCGNPPLTNKNPPLRTCALKRGRIGSMHCP